MNADLHGTLDSSWSLRLFLKGRLTNFQNSPPEELTNISHQRRRTLHVTRSQNGWWAVVVFFLPWFCCCFFCRPQSFVQRVELPNPNIWAAFSSTLSSQTLALAMEMPGLCCFKGSNKMSAGMKLWQLGNNVPLSHRIAQGYQYQEKHVRF